MRGGSMAGKFFKFLANVYDEDVKKAAEEKGSEEKSQKVVKKAVETQAVETQAVETNNKEVDVQIKNDDSFEREMMENELEAQREEESEEYSIFGSDDIEDEEEKYLNAQNSEKINTQIKNNQDGGKKRRIKKGKKGKKGKKKQKKQKYSRKH